MRKHGSTCYHCYHEFRALQLYAEWPPSNHTDALRHLRDCVDELKRWLDHNHLLLNESKTEAIVFRSSTARITPDETTVNVCGASVPLLTTIRDIGVILDNGLDMSAQVSNACRGAYFHLFRIAKIRKCLDTAACKTLVHSLVTSRIDYGNAVLYGISDRLLHRLEMVQRSAARVVLQIRRGDRRSMTEALKLLHWLPVKWRVVQATCSCVPSPARPNPGLPRLVDFAIRAEPRPSISWAGVADCSAAQPGAVRSPFFLVCGADLVECASRGHTHECEHYHFQDKT